MFTVFSFFTQTFGAVNQITFNEFKVSIFLAAGEWSVVSTSVTA